MGIFSDVTVPIEDMLRGPEAVARSVVYDRIYTMLYEVNRVLVDLNLRALDVAFDRAG